MLGDIKEIVDNNVFVNLAIDLAKQANLVDLHVIFEDGNDKVVGQIVSTTKTDLKANIVGEIKNNSFIPGVSSKPSFRSSVRIVNMEELALILGKQTPDKGEVLLDIQQYTKTTQFMLILTPSLVTILLF